MSKQRHLGVRVLKATDRRILRALRALRREQPGIKWTRSTLVRVALDRYLTEEEARREAADAG